MHISVVNFIIPTWQLEVKFRYYRLMKKLICIQLQLKTYEDIYSRVLNLTQCSSYFVLQGFILIAFLIKVKAYFFE
jgi:hypothetical protein